MITSHFLVKDGRCRTFHLRPFGDLQYGSAGFDKELWARYVKDAASDRDGFTVGMGDYTDLWRPTMQARLRGITADDRDAGDNFFDLHRRHMEKVAEMLAPVIKSGIGCLGMVDGHHFLFYEDTQMTSTQYLCLVLKDMTKRTVPYLGEMSAFVVMHFSHGLGKGKFECSEKLVVHVQHGEGGAGYISTDMAKLERRTAPSFQADLYLRGHSTKLYAGGHDIIMPGPYCRTKMAERSTDVTHRSVLLVNTGGFMRAYTGLRASYVERKMMPPARLGWATVNIKLTANNGDRRFDLSATV